MAKKDGANKPEVPAAKAVDIDVNNDTVEEDEGQIHGIDWYIEQYARLDAVGFDSEWKRGVLLVDAIGELPTPQYKKFINAVLGQSLRHAQRWVKVVKTFAPYVVKSDTTVQELGHVGMTKLSVIASNLSGDQWKFVSGRIHLRKDENSPWKVAHKLTVAAIEELRGISQDPFAAMREAIDNFRTIEDYGSPDWNVALRSLYDEHHEEIKKRIESVNAEITKLEASIDKREKEKDSLEDIQEYFDSFNSNARRENEEIKAENARLQEQIRDLLASRHSDHGQELDSNVESLTPMTF